MRAFDHHIRVLICKNCGAPLPAPPAGGSVQCAYCSTISVVGPKPSPPLADALSEPPEPTLTPMERMRRLRAQLDERLLPPPSLPWRLMDWNGRDDSRLAAHALVTWNEARAELEREGERADAEARLFFLTIGLANYHGRGNVERLRAMLETAHEVCRDRRHKAVLLGEMVRQAARTGDLEAAEQWLADLDPRSSNIYCDTAWRVGRATIDTKRRDFVRVLEVLGESDGEIPMALLYANAVAIYRANAHEKLGRIDRSKLELERALARTGASPRGMFESVRDQPELELVPRGLELVILPRFRRWTARHRVYLVVWQSTTALLALQWMLTRYGDASWLEPFASLHLFHLGWLWPALLVFVVGFIPHWRWRP